MTYRVPQAVSSKPLPIKSKEDAADRIHRLNETIESAIRAALGSGCLYIGFQVSTGAFPEPAQDKSDDDGADTVRIESHKTRCVNDGENGIKICSTILNVYKGHQSMNGFSVETVCIEDPKIVGIIKRKLEDMGFSKHIDVQDALEHPLLLDQNDPDCNEKNENNGENNGENKKSEPISI